MRKGKEGGKKEFLRNYFVLSYHIFVPIFYYFYILMNYFCFYHNEERDLSISTPKIIFIHFEVLITLFNFNHIKWYGPKMLY